MRKIERDTALDKQVEAWLKSKGVKPEEVSADYSITRDDGLTMLTVTFFAEGFPLAEPEPVSRETDKPVPVPVLCGWDCKTCQAREASQQ